MLCAGETVHSWLRKQKRPIWELLGMEKSRLVDAEEERKPVKLVNSTVPGCPKRPTVVDDHFHGEEALHNMQPSKHSL